MSEQQTQDPQMEQGVAEEDSASPEASSDDELGILDADVDEAEAPEDEEGPPTGEDALMDGAGGKTEDVDAPAAAERPHDKKTFVKQEPTREPHWYVVYTYSGYEKRVMTNLLKTVANHNLQNVILDVKVPEEDTIETKNGKRRHVTRKLYPGYVMVKMLLTDEAWYVVRNTRGVTGFVGPGSKPIPLSDTEVRAMGIENVRISLDVKVGDTVMVKGGPFENFVGEVEGVDMEKQSVKVRISLFGRDVPMDLDFVLVKKI